jgi:hypothetical protein
MTSKYSFDTVLDLGDLGLVPAHVEGLITRPSVLRNPFGIVHAKVTHVSIAFTNHPALIDVTSLVTKNAMIELEERLEGQFRHEQKHPPGGDDHTEGA